jgi:hypothetical protein
MVHLTQANKVRGLTSRRFALGTLLQLKLNGYLFAPRFKALFGFIGLGNMGIIEGARSGICNLMKFDLVSIFYCKAIIWREIYSKKATSLLFTI